MASLAINFWAAYWTGGPEGASTQSPGHSCLSVHILLFSPSGMGSAYALPENSMTTSRTVPQNWGLVRDFQKLVRYLFWWKM